MGTVHPWMWTCWRKNLSHLIWLPVCTFCRPFRLILLKGSSAAMDGGGRRRWVVEKDGVEQNGQRRIIQEAHVTINRQQPYQISPQTACYSLHHLPFPPYSDIKEKNTNTISIPLLPPPTPQLSQCLWSWLLCWTFMVTSTVISRVNVHWLSWELCLNRFSPVSRLARISEDDPTTTT